MYKQYNCIGIYTVVKYKLLLIKINFYRKINIYNIKKRNMTFNLPK